MNLETLVVGVLVTNCYLLYSKDSKDGILIDPGGDAGKILNRIKDLGLNVTHILLTHAHIDHVLAVPDIRERFPQAKLALHKLDVPMLKRGGLLGFGKVSKPETILCNCNNDIYFRIIHTPGHTPGSACFYLEEGIHGSAPVLFSGDTLFRLGIGRADLPGSDSQAILKSVQEKLFTLPKNTFVYPGHGPTTTIGEEMSVFQPWVVGI